jgi:hypothetical protein
MSENSAVPNEVPNEVPKEVCKRLCEWLGLDTRSPITLWNSGNRTFTTGNDMLALKEKLVAEGLWEEFCGYARYYELANIWTYQFLDWFLNPVRFALLVDEFLRRGEKGKRNN